MKITDIEEKLENFLKTVKVDKYKFLNCEIPITQPITEKQFKICKTLWPVNLQPTYYSNIVYTHKESEKDLIFKIINTLKENNYDCLVYDPNTKKIITTQEVDEKFSGNPISHSIMKLIDKFCSELNKISLNIKTKLSNEDLIFTEQYFMENMYIFSNHEPCPMCSMALTHSRIKRLYYLKPSDNGSIETMLKLCNYENLNHTFISFRIDDNSFSII